MSESHLPTLLKKYKITQQYGPKRKNPNYLPSEKFMSGVIATIQLAVNREAKKSGIKNKICDSKWAEFTNYWNSLCDYNGGDIVRSLWDTIEPITITSILSGNRHALGYEDHRDIPTNGNTTDPKFPGGKWFWDQNDGRPRRKQLRDFVTSFIKYCKKNSYVNIVEQYKNDSTRTKQRFWKQITTVK